MSCCATMFCYSCINPHVFWLGLSQIFRITFDLQLGAKSSFLVKDGNIRQEISGYCEFLIGSVFPKESRSTRLRGRWWAKEETNWKSQRLEFPKLKKQLQSWLKKVMTFVSIDGSRWSFWVFFIFTPKIREDSHFDSYFWNWVETTT